MAIAAKNIFRGDRSVWVVIIFLSIISLIEVYSSLGKAAYDHGWSVTWTMFRHLRIVLVSYLIMIGISHLRIKWFYKLSRPGYLLCFVLMGVMIVMSFYGHMSDSASGHAANRWLDNIPLIGQFQPSEIAKYVLLVYLARQLTKYRDSLKDKETFKRLMIPVLLIAGMIFPENFSTAALVFVACVVLMFLAGVNRRYLFTTVGVILGAVTLFLIVCVVFDLELFRSSTWVNRIDEWWSDDKDQPTQTNMAKIAIASGGLTGAGPGNTVQGRFLNESHTDFIYSVIIEEMGGFVGVLILLAYLFFFIRCMIISKNCSSLFGQLLVLGLGFVIFLQAMINMSVATGYFPVTGQTLPLVSYGGTSYVLTCTAIGIILAVSHKNKIDKLKLESGEDDEPEPEPQTGTTNESNN